VNQEFAACLSWTLHGIEIVRKRRRPLDVGHLPPGDKAYGQFGAETVIALTHKGRTASAMSTRC
jgi:hypothetical protein